MKPFLYAYGDKVAIEFAHWLRANNFSTVGFTHHNDQEVKYEWCHANEHATFTEAKLYDLYLSDMYEIDVN